MGLRAGLGLGLLLLGGCPQESGYGLGGRVALETGPDWLPQIVQSSLQTAARDRPTDPLTPQAVPHEVCAGDPTWVRPPWEEHQAALRRNPRYGVAIDREPLRSLGMGFWQESVIAFTTYGLSARMEPTNLTGLWTVMDTMADCHGDDRAEAINRGDLGEIWLIGHQVVDLTWVGGQYVLTVIPTAQGVQFVQFQRQEQGQTLPLVVVTPDGQALSAISGDW